MADRGLFKDEGLTKDLHGLAVKLTALTTQVFNVQPRKNGVSDEKTCILRLVWMGNNNAFRFCILE